ncbi:MAG: hypothetical protein HY864_08050 [Chloroflexi bacterium]|nr:hypothetical protein [Chloroflexota bacterium]
MNELPYFYFVVLSKPKSWPYFAEIPYAAWPDEALSYNSNGNCEHVFDRNWSYLDVMNWETHENLIVCNANMFTDPLIQKTRQLIEKNLSGGDDLLATGHIARLLLYWLENIPAEYRMEGNAIIGSFRCNRPRLSAAAVHLFMKRLRSDQVWDAQSSQVLDSTQLQLGYLTDFPVEPSQKLANEVQQLFSQAEVKYESTTDKEPVWWKTISQVRAFVNG